MSSKSLVTRLSETIHILRKLQKINILGMSLKILPYSYIAPSSGHELLNLNLHF